MSGGGEITSWERLGARRSSPAALTAALSGEAVQVVRAELAAGASFEPHSHPHEQITVVLAGRGVASVGELREPVGPGSLVRVPGGLPHGLEVSEEGPMTTIEVFSPPRRNLSHEEPA